LQQILDAANQNFRGRYLFAGSQTTTRPFEIVDGYVRYNGNEGNIPSFADIDLLVSSNISGEEVFGSLSGEVRGSVDLSPNLTANTLLSSLRGGQGIRPGSIAISDGLNTSIIDISSAVTVGDLEALLEANPPEGVPPTGRTVSVTITSTGLNVQLNGFSSSGLTIKEVGEGTTAAELGILAEAGLGVGPVVGADLDPLLTKTTLLSDLPVAVDLASGLQIVNGGRTYTIDFSAAQTVEDLLNTLNGSGASVLAEINSAGTGINLRSRLSGGDFAVGENGGTTATDLGLRSFTAQTDLDELNHGFGVHAREGTDFAGYRHRHGEHDRGRDLADQHGRRRAGDRATGPLWQRHRAGDKRYIDDRRICGAEGVWKPGGRGFGAHPRRPGSEHTAGGWRRRGDDHRPGCASAGSERRVQFADPAAAVAGGR
jgi:flagellar hook-associated protein 3 FlgL